MKRCYCFAGAALAMLSAPAANYYLNKNLPNSTEAYTAAAASYWTDLDTGLVATGAIAPEDDCYVYDNRTFQVSSKATPFPGHAFHVGNADATSVGRIPLRTDFSCSDIRWHAGSIYPGSGGQAFTVKGGTVTLDGDMAAHQLCFTTANPVSTAPGWSLFMNSKLVCARADVVLDVLLTDDAKEDCYVNSSKAPVDALISLTGNNNGFTGKIRVSTFGHLALAHANAAGDPATARADAIELADHSRLTVKSGVTPNAARGIAITGADAQIHARTYATSANATYGCSSVKLPMPITGTYGFTKMGDGTVTLAGAYTAGDIVVTNGTLVLDEAGTFPSGLKVTVHDGATLVQKIYVPAIDVDCKAGGTYVKDFSRDVPYEASTGVSTPLDLAAGLDYVPLKIALSEPIALPFYETNRIDLATVPSTATAADFVDASPKTFGLPNTSFEIEDRGGTKMLVLVARPVVVSVKDFANGSGGLGGSGDRWSDGEVARAGFDYLVTNKIDGLANEFHGDSVTIAKISNNLISLRSTVSRIGNATVYPNIALKPNNGAFPDFHFDGNSSIRTINDGSDYNVVFETLWANGGQREMRVKVNLPLSGDGQVLLRSSDARARNIEITGNNGAFTGRLQVTSTGSPTADNHTLCHVADAPSLGGPLDAFRFDALYLDQYAQIVPKKSFVLDAANRGVYVENGGFCVSNDITLTILQPLRVNGTLFKDGAGTLALGGAASFGAEGTAAGSQNAFRVREGAVKALADEAVAGFATTFGDGTKILLDPTVALTDGFTGTVAIEDGATVTVDVEGLEAGSVVTLPICTVPDDSLAFALAAPSGFRAVIVKENVTRGSTACVRYSATYAPAGLTVIFR